MDDEGELKYLRELVASLKAEIEKLKTENFSLKNRLLDFEKQES